MRIARVADTAHAVHRGHAAYRWRSVSRLPAPLTETCASLAASRDRSTSPAPFRSARSARRRCRWRADLPAPLQLQGELGAGDPVLQVNSPAPLISSASSVGAGQVHLAGCCRWNQPTSARSCSMISHAIARPGSSAPLQRPLRRRSWSAKPPGRPRRRMSAAPRISIGVKSVDVASFSVRTGPVGRAAGACSQQRPAWPRG